MPYIEPSRETLRAFFRSDIEGPIHMLNMLRFKPEGGRDAYARYVASTHPILERVGGRVVYEAHARAAVIGPDAWDAVAIVEYPSLQSFVALVTDPEYLEGMHHRTEALEDSRLVCLQLSTDAVPRPR